MDCHNSLNFILKSVGIDFAIILQIRMIRGERSEHVLVNEVNSLTFLGMGEFEGENLL